MLRRLLGAVVIVAAVAFVVTQAVLAVSLDEGEVDIGIAYEAGDWDLHAHDEGTDIEYKPDEVTLVAKSGAKSVIPNDPAFAFLGTPGDPIWVLPQVEDPNLLFLGLATEEIEDGVFVGDEIDLALVSVSGPGDLFVYTTDTFGDPQDIYFNSADGIDGSDSVTIPAGNHQHVNWAFSAAGNYDIGFEASGTLVAGNVFTSSGEVVYDFQVVPNPDPTPPSVGGIGLSPDLNGPVMQSNAQDSGGSIGLPYWAYGVLSAALLVLAGGLIKAVRAR
jgi:surface-anchored protein